MGAGPMVRLNFFPALRRLEREGALVVCAIVESSPAAREAAASSFPHAGCYETIEFVPVEPGSLAVVSTPGRFRVAHTVAALKRGWHVLCSSPLADSAQDGAVMIASAERQDRLLAVDLRSRFLPAARFLRAVCLDHLLGPPVRFRVAVGQPGDGEELDVGKLPHPDGVLFDPGLETLDFLMWCLGTPSIVAYADDAMGGVEANAAVQLAFAEGVRGTIQLSRDWPTEGAFHFVFERGIVRWDARNESTLALQLASAPAALVGDLGSPLSPVAPNASLRLPATREDACVAELRNCLAAIAGRQKLRVPASEAMPSLALLQECYARRTPLPQPWLPHNEAAHARALCPAAVSRPA